MSTRDSIISAVLQYYSSDSDIYKKVMSGQGLTFGEMNAVLSSVPYMVPVTAMSGERVGIDVHVPFKDVNPDREWLQSLLDSNQGGSSYGGSDTFSGSVPGDFSYDPNSGTYTAISGAKDSFGNMVPVVADKVSLAVSGINTGAKLGLKLDEALYNADPDFWESIFGPGSSPDDFKRAVCQDGEGNKFIRTLFGIKDGEVTPYLSDETIAHVYKQFRDRGYLDPASETYTKNNISIIASNPASVSVPIKYNNNLALENVTSNATGNSKMIQFKRSDTNGVEQMVVSRSQNVSVTTTVIRTGALESNDTYTNNYSLSRYVLSDGTIAFYRNARSAILTGAAYPDVYNPDITLSLTPRDILETIYTGTRRQNGPVQGLSNLPSDQAPYGVPDPSVITGSTLDDVINQLKQNYPDLFSNPITISTPQPDGSVNTKTYYPVPWASTTPSTQATPQQQTQPTTKPEVRQDVDTMTDEEITETVPHPTPDPVVTPTVVPTPDPEPSPDPVPTPSTPAIPPTDTTTPPDTGEGENTPPNIPVGHDNAMWAVYNPSNAALNAFGAWLWSPNFIDNLLRLFQSPIDGIIGIHKVFITPNRGGAQNIVVGYLDSGVASITVPSQYAECNCGSVDLPEYFGNVFDYAPYTEVSIYLPFIGIAKLDVADVMRSTISVKYRCDVYTGACLAMISVKRDGFSPIMYTYAGDCAVHYPTSAGSYSGIISSVISAGVSALAAGVATGGNPVMGAVAAGASFLTHNKGLSVEHSGGLSGNSGAMGPKKPYLIIKRPQPEMAVDADVYDGIPANYTTSIASCTGYIKCKEVHLKVPNAFQSELDEIEELLKSGILISDT